MTTAITLNGLTKRYGRVDALSGLTLEVPAGSIFGFLGPNGAGKTTALKILAGLTRASSGSATVNGVPVGVQGAHRAGLGYDVTVHEGQTEAVQGAVMRLAADAGLIVASNRQEALDLERVFLSIVDQERAA
jgi:ABC-type uncharacterized transport system ATPase subunit